MNKFIGCDNIFEESNIVIFGAPFDGTTSFRPGTRFGPPAIRNESFGIETFSPYQERDLCDCHICDLGDIDLPFGNVGRVLEMIRQQEEKIINAGKKAVMLGGEHLVTLGAIRAAAEKYPDVSVIHLDAHADLRDEYIDEKLSHATVIRRVWDILGDGRIFQFGIRSGERDEFDFAKNHTHMQKYSLDGLDEVLEKLKGKPVYFTLDLDILDPSVFPGTGTPEAGGISFDALLGAILKLKGQSIVACDICELSPSYDASGVSTAVACKVLREILLAL